MHAYQSSRFLVSSGDANIENFLYWENGESGKQTMFCFFTKKKNILLGSLEWKWGSNTFWSMEAQEWLCIFTQDHSQGRTISSGTEPMKNKIPRLLVQDFWIHKNRLCLLMILSSYFSFYSYFIVLSAQVRVESEKYKECWRVLFFLQILLKQSEMYGLTRSH